MVCLCVNKLEWYAIFTKIEKKKPNAACHRLGQLANSSHITQHHIWVPLDEI